jgi:hypothetical protein
MLWLFGILLFFNRISFLLCLFIQYLEHAQLQLFIEHLPYRHGLPLRSSFRWPSLVHDRLDLVVVHLIIGIVFTNE